MFVGSKDVSKFVDHTLLKADTDYAGIRRLCNEAMAEGFFAVCVNPFWVNTAVQLLKGKDVKVCSVIGFPLGADSVESKVFQAETALRQGARELDMVVNLGAIKSGDYYAIIKEIERVKGVAAGNVLKVIIETCVLKNEEKVNICRLARKCGADFIKTSTGFGVAGATVEDIRLIRETVGPYMGVKASGGVKDLDIFIKMIKAGADRIGSSSSVGIMKEYRQKYQREEL